MLERGSWSVRSEDVYEELVQLVGLGAGERALLGALQEAAAAGAPAMARAFYDRLVAFANTREFFDGVDLQRMHGVTGQWFAELFSGRYDASYVKRRLNIGLVHVRIGLPVRYPLAMLDVIAGHGERIASRSDQPEAALAAFRKVMALDVAIFNQAYEDNQLRHLSELVGGERLARRLLAGLG
jgi:hypothetical protein